MVKGTYPLNIYLYEEGLARFATVILNIYFQYIKCYLNYKLSILNK